MLELNTHRSSSSTPAAATTTAEQRRRTASIAALRNGRGEEEEEAELDVEGEFSRVRAIQKGHQKIEKMYSKWKTQTVRTQTHAFCPC